MSKNKTTGLAAFTKPKTGETQETRLETLRTRGKRPVVALSIRMTRPDWERLHQLAVAEGVSINRLALLGLSRLFAEKGLPPLESLTKS
jgi:hypothetical protein